MVDDVLIPTDGSDGAGVAVDHGVELAARFDATAHVVHVVDVQRTETAPHSEEWRREGEDLVGDVAEEVRGRGVAVETDVRTGYPADCILGYAADRGVDLVTMGTHGRTGVSRYVLGSVAESVVRQSEVPVLTVRLSAERPHYYPFDDVLVATDGGPGARAATDWALAVADAYGGTVHGLSVVETAGLGIDVRSHVHAEEVRDTAETAVEAVVDAARQAGLDGRSSVVEGTPYQEIREYVEAHGVDLVVVGTHGQSDVDPPLLGSVTERTVRTVPVPVLTVPQAATD